MALKPEPKPEPTTPVKLFYDYWLTENDRRKAGEIIDLPIPAAKAIIAAGKAERADPFPGAE
jgi:hypothetical protein